MAANNLQPTVLIVVLISISLSSINLLTKASNNIGVRFSVDLIHRDSPQSPLYNPLETNLDRLERALNHSISRMSSFNNIKKSPSNQVIESTVIPTGGMFLLNISVGTPPIQTLAIADTGSDLSWTQCSPCIGCYKQDLPLFNPKHSSTYKDLSCHAKPCVDLGSVTCNNNNSICNYSYGYGDGSLAIGHLATETFTFSSNGGSSVVLPGLVFGCGHNNTGTFSARETGIIGLGGGPISLISQLGPTIGWRFSYCFVPSNTSLSTMSFGGAVLSGPGVVTTALIRGQHQTLYFVTLDAISVAVAHHHKRIVYNSSAKANNTGNTFIDSGSYFTVLPAELYNEFESELRAAVKLEATTLGGLKLCYRTETEKGMPNVILHFRGADVLLKPMNYFIRPEGDESLLCLSIVSGDGDVAIIGNRSQMNLMIGYDLEAGTVSFKPADCTKAT